jgi:rhamnulokinase
VRSIVESLAAAFADAVRAAAELSGKTVSVIHLVGGGSQNALLCQLTADTVGVPVVAGPVEATAIGNLLVQARTHGLIRGDLEALRAVIARSFPPRTYAVRPRTKG